MALTAPNVVTATDINNLKNRVKDEMGRRNATGSLSSYATNFSTAATSGSNPTFVRKAHYDETVGYIIKIAPISGFNATVTAGTSIVYSINAASTRLQSNEDRSKYHKTDNSTDCNSSCTGLCYTACSGSCRGCSGSCSGGCQGCSGSCSGGCKGGCSDACSKNCNSTCRVDGSSACALCAVGCQEKCSSYCYGAT